MLDHLRDGQLLILRSTVYPGVTAHGRAELAPGGHAVDVAFCPERIAEGKAMVELFELPQIVSGRTERAIDRAEALFRPLTDAIVYLDVEEAELAKLFTNTWRYIKFAAANQLYMIANDFGLDFERIRTRARARLPACRRHARSRPRRRSVSAQGHDAARRRSTTTTSRSATPA